MILLAVKWKKNKLHWHHSVSFKQIDQPSANMLSNIAKGVLLRRTQPLAVQSVRSYTVTSPPKTPLSPAMKILGFVSIFCGGLGPGAYIMAHLDDYKGKGED